MAVFVSNVRVAHCRFTIASGTAQNQRLVGAGQQGKLTLLLKDEE